MTHIAPLVTVALTSLLGWSAAGASILCTWTKVLPNGEEHSSFLRQDSSSLRLYHSVRSTERALRGCAWSDDAAATQNYLSLCRERTPEFAAHSGGNANVNFALEAEDRCDYLPSPRERAGKRPVRSADGPPAAMNGQGQDERSEVKIRPRVKRGFIVPGTLWCGSGNKAPSYDDLGVFANTDGCCREHDQCKHTILSFHSEFGVFNTNIFTMSHCECDNKFRRCLMEANDSISHVVGYTFFNLLKMHCFEFSHRLQCTQRNWFGLCKESKMALYAEVHPPTLFEYTSPTEVSMNGSSISNTTTPAELQGSSVSEPSIFFVSVPTPSTGSPSASADASTAPTPLTCSLSASADASTVATPSTGSSSANAEASTVLTPSTSSPSASVGAVTSVTASTVTGRTDNVENTLPSKMQPQEWDSDIKGKLSACGVYKDLDKCRNKIPPHGNRFGLHNPEPRTLYHCNCTSRLYQTVAEQTRLTEVQALLLEHVSQSCFLPRDCSAGQTCTAVLVQAEFPPAEPSGRAEVEGQRHLQAIKRKVSRPKSVGAKRKDGGVRLHKRCLRMVRRKRNQSRTRPAATGEPV